MRKKISNFSRKARSRSAGQFPISNFGFTLIELLVVISIIGILATLLISRYGMAEKSARDTQRKSDLNQYRTALENFTVRTSGLYPSRTSTCQAHDSSCLCSALSPTYLSVCPQDPRQDGSTFYYRYLSNGTGGNTATQYILFARMETGSGTTNYWYVCANGKSGEKTTSPAASDCW